MLDNDGHLPDRDILLAVDGELPSRRASTVRKHLAACWTCRARMAEIDRAIAEFVGMSRDLGPSLPPAHASRTQLKAQLNELSRAARPSPSFRLFRWRLNLGNLALVSIALLLVVFGALALNVHRRSAQRESVPAASEFEAVSVPRASLTPGVVRAVSTRDVCKQQGDEAIRAVPVSMQRKVFQEYGMANAPQADYELDYLITPELGGAEDIRNLWPEPHSSTVWNSYVKDDLENYLHQQVCAGRLKLSAAQHDIATDWIAAYKKYFHTDRPRPIHSSPNSVNHPRPTT
jgi:anti-sigma factor RsiW